MANLSLKTRRCALALLACAGALSGGCKKSASDADAIRAGITQHLTALGTLNLTAMDMNVDNVSIEGKQARAQVTFRPKSGAPAGAGMQVTYQLEKRETEWFVVKTEGLGGGIEHPAANANPHVPADSSKVHSGNLPNFRELIPSTAGPGGGELPPGHPPVDSSAKTKAADSPTKQN